MPRQRERIKEAQKRRAAALKGLLDNTKNQKNLPHMAEFYEALFKAKGGADEVARMAWDAYDDASKAQQIRFLTALLTGVKDIHDRGLTGNAEDDNPALWSDEEIEHYLTDISDEGLDGEPES